MLKLTEKAKKNLKIIAIVFILVLVAVFAVVIWQTVVINNLSGEIASLKEKNESEENKNAELEEKIAYFESEEFKEEFAKYELEYVKDGEKIYK